MMRNGTIYQLPPLALGTEGRESSSWLTPSATNWAPRSEEAVAKRTAYRNSIGRQTAPPGSLAEQVAYGHPTRDMKFPTPRSPRLLGGSGSREMIRTLVNGGQLTEAEATKMMGVRTFPTPTTMEHIDKRGQRNDGGGCKPNLATVVAMFPTPATQEPGWKNIEVVDKNGNPPEHPNQRFYDKNTGRVVQKGLTQIAKMFPTPTTQEVEHKEMEISSTGRRMTKDGMNSHSIGLADAVKTYPTPRASEYKGTGPLGSKSHEYRLQKGYLDATAQETEQKSGQLNPTWVEWLMGFPQGWTELSASETPSSRRSRKSSGR